MTAATRTLSPALAAALLEYREAEIALSEALAAHDTAYEDYRIYGYDTHSSAGRAYRAAESDLTAAHKRADAARRALCQVVDARLAGVSNAELTYAKGITE